MKNEFNKEIRLKLEFLRFIPYKSPEGDTIIAMDVTPLKNKG